MVSSVGLLLGVIHFFVWLRGGQQLAWLLSAIMAFAAGVLALLELSLMTQTAPEGYQRILFWNNVAIFAILVPMTWFVYVCLGTAQRWMAITITAAWVFGIMINFVMPGNLAFSSVSTVYFETTFWGERFAMAKGTVNPFKFVADLASLLIVIYVAMATWRAYRRGLRRRGLVIGGSILFFIIVAGVHTPLVDAGIVKTPFMISFSFIAIAMAMSVELVDQVVRTAAYGRELASWEKKWTSLLNEIHLAVVGLDQNGRINYVNPFFRETTGLNEAQLLGRPAAKLVPKSHLSRFQQWLSAAPESGPGTGIQFPLETASSERREIVWSTVSLRNGDGEYAGMLSIGEDITDKLRARKELHRTQLEIEHLTRALILGELGSTLAHELNQPLAAILSNAQAAQRLLKQENANLDEIQEILTDVVADDRRAGEVIERMRSLLKKGTAGSEVFELNDTVKEVLTLVEGERKRVDATIELQLSLSPIMISGGRVQIQQVIMNLIVNALWAVAPKPLGNRRIRIESSCSADEVLIAVEDNGPGVSKALERRLFQPFASTRTTGLGMGLAISRRIIMAHDGSIKLSKGNLGGARFEVSLPLSARRMEAVDAG